MAKLDGKVALITGAARGQGRSHALRLAEEGADIIAVDICEQIESVNYPMSTPEDLDETVTQVEDLDRRIVARQADVRDLTRLRTIVDEGVAELGRLDIVVANAGVCPLGADLPPQTYTDVVDVNLGGVNNAVSASIRHLSEGASIVCTGSVAGLLGATNSPEAGVGGAAYGHSKRGVVEFVRDLARELAPFSIRANAVHPTNCNTPMLQSDPMYRMYRPDLENPTREEAEQAFPSMNAMPVGYVEARDMSNAVLFLASDDARYVTGQQLAVDAGALLKG